VVGVWAGRGGGKGGRFSIAKGRGGWGRVKRKGVGQRNSRRMMSWLYSCSLYHQMGRMWGGGGPASALAYWGHAASVCIRSVGACTGVAPLALLIVLPAIRCCADSPALCCGACVSVDSVKQAVLLWHKMCAVSVHCVQACSGACQWAALQSHPNNGKALLSLLHCAVLRRSRDDCCCVDVGAVLCGAKPSGGG
jgi:hypothetical protein